MDSVFQALGEKPRYEVVRIGKKVAGSVRPRPVKVTLSNLAFVIQILAKVRKLRTIEIYKNVYLCPDRSSKQRDLHRQLVIDMKTKQSADPTKRHYIRNGLILSIDRDKLKNEKS